MGFRGPGANYRKAPESVIMGHTSANIAANSTNYHVPMGIDGGSANILLRETIFPINAILSTLWVEAVNPPGAGETFDYEIMINGVGSGIAVQIAGAVAVQGSDLVNAAAIVPGDTISFEITTSLNAAVTRHFWGFVVRT